MKKIKKSVNCPPLLSSYKQRNPNQDWDSFKRNSTRRKEVKEQLIQDQRGLCAYCEINLVPRGGEENQQSLDDFRVEHFHPKNPHDPPPNYALDWNNLLGVCHGGSSSSVIGDRFTSPDHSCDVPKADLNLDGIILNPLTDVPTNPRIFRYIEQSTEANRAGDITLDLEHCPEDLQEKAQNTIDKLRLSAPRLSRRRAFVVDQLREEFTFLLEQGFSEEESLKKIAQATLKLDANNEWLAFFTCIRWYLGDEAEKHLEEIGYEEMGGDI